MFLTAFDIIRCITKKTKNPFSEKTEKGRKNPRYHPNSVIKCSVRILERISVIESVAGHTKCRLSGTPYSKTALFSSTNFGEVYVFDEPHYSPIF